jgi:nitroreductase
MSGIVFLKTRNLQGMIDFYVNRAGMTVWLTQAECVILKHGNLLLGFCERDEVDLSGVFTIFYESREEVDRAYTEFEDVAKGEPCINDRYQIYHFYARDPEDRVIEFQAFLHPCEPFFDGAELLVERRSIRRFDQADIPDELLFKVLESCRFAPSSRNSQPCYYVVVRKRETLESLASLRGAASAPIARAPLAVAVCADPGKSKRHIQDGCIAAYHFLLSARLHGLGTCWIAAMDRKEVKKALGIPSKHYVATVTPLGFPAERPERHERKEVDEIVRFIPD